MGRIDPEQERQRLVAFYSGQMDGELEKVATQAYELTDLAREALEAEIARRGLGVELVENAPVIAKKELPVMPDQPIPENFDMSGVGECEQPSCPKCGSLDVNFQELDSAAYLSLAIVPMPFHRKAWRCHACRAEWTDDEVDAGGSESHS